MAPSRAAKQGAKPVSKKAIEEEYSDDSEGSDPSILDTAEGGEVNDDSESGSESEGSSDDDDEEEEDSGEDVKQKLSTVSFGALAKAQRALEETGNTSNKKRKRGGEKSDEAEAKLSVLRQRLKELKESRKETKPSGDGLPKNLDRSEKRRKVSEDHSDAPEDEEGSVESDEESEPVEEVTAKTGRSSKHAPTSQSSKRAVTRKRTVIPMAKSTVRDPRFDPLTGPLDSESISKKYAFLETYRTSEISTMKATLKNPKLPESERETTKKQLLSMESKQKQKNREDAEKKVLREHRKAEKDLIAQGKTPFYLKKSETKKQALVERFEGMKSKERNKVVERRRKKLSQKERKSMPDARRA